MTITISIAKAAHTIQNCLSVTLIDDVFNHYLIDIMEKLN